LKNKTEQSKVRNRLGLRIKIIRTDCNIEQVSGPAGTVASASASPLLLSYRYAPSTSTRRLYTDEVIPADVQRALSR
jgi:hypothetical protein